MSQHRGLASIVRRPRRAGADQAAAARPPRRRAFAHARTRHGRYSLRPSLLRSLRARGRRTGVDSANAAATAVEPEQTGSVLLGSATSPLLQISKNGLDKAS